MKKLNKLFIILAIASFLFASCADSSKKLVGSWTNSKTEITNPEQVAQALYKNSLNYYEGLKSMYSSMMNDPQATDSIKTNYQNVINQLDEEIQKLNIDSIKNQMTNTKIGVFKFNPDSTLTLSKDGDSIQGTWSIVKNQKTDTLYITIQSSKVALAIESISSKELKLVQNNKLDSLNFDMIYFFTKE